MNTMQRIQNKKQTRAMFRDENDGGGGGGGIITLTRMVDDQENCNVKDSSKMENLNE